MCIRYNFYSILVLFCLFVANVWAVTLPNGVEAPVENVIKHKNGSIKEAYLLEPREMETPIGSFIFLGLIFFDENGRLSGGDLANEVEITTPIGLMKTSFLSFHKNGKLDGIRCTEGTKIKTPIGEVELLYNKMVYDHKYDKYDGFEMFKRVGNGLVAFDEKGNVFGCAWVDINKANAPLLYKTLFAACGQSLAIFAYFDGIPLFMPMPSEQVEQNKDLFQKALFDSLLK